MVLHRMRGCHIYIPSPRRYAVHQNIQWVMVDNDPEPGCTILMEFRRARLPEEKLTTQELTDIMKNLGIITREFGAGDNAGEGEKPRPTPNEDRNRSALSRERSPVLPHVLHSLPCRYREGDRASIAAG